ncbi:MAG: hypothetical protein ACRD63_16500, partial [Pyrinomonadaceae bacterium]
HVVEGGAGRVDNPYFVSQVLDAFGGSHRLGRTGSFNESLDATGIRTASGIITDSQGIRYSKPQGIECGGLFEFRSLADTNMACESPLREDTNGNRISFSGTTGWIDTLGRNIPLPQPTNDFSGCTGPQPTVGAEIWNLPGLSGGSYQVKLCHANVRTKLGIGEWSSTGNFKQIQSLVLPNGTAWTFQYTTDGSGDLTQITFPTGGTITYTWERNNTDFCMGNTTDDDIVPRIVTRTIDPNDGTGPKTWQYNYSCTHFPVDRTTLKIVTGVVTDSLGNDTMYTLSPLDFFPTIRASLYEIEKKIFQGPRFVGTLLWKINTDYSWFRVPDISPDGLDISAVSVVPIRTTITLPDGTVSKVEMDYD